MRAITSAFLLAAALVGFCHQSSALQIHQYSQQRHLRFDPGSFPAAPAPNETLWVKQHNFHGVGWSANDTRKGFALITPRHFVGANHFRPSTGSQVKFFSADGQVRSYTYSKFYRIKNRNNENTDIFIGELSEEIPASHGVPLYPLLDRPELELIGSQIIVYGCGQSGPRIGRGMIEIFSHTFPAGIALNDTRNYSFVYRNATASQDDAYGEIGDSGSPSFVATDGLLALTGIHSAIVQTTPTTTTFDSFLLHYKDQINDHLAATGHQLTLAPLGDTSLGISEVARINDEIVLHIVNPAGLPYDVLRSPEIDIPEWELIATSQTASTWTGAIPPGTDRYFWKLIRYPLARDLSPD